ncbi:MAG: hypothetical protein QOJ19_556 [Acidimicrobiia bacterium]|nr:hypothetical protein [Acidimicrobiia bacterium]
MSTKHAGNRHGSAVITTPSDTEILITRAFDAPAALVFKAYTTPDLVKRWWGFETSEWLVCDIDLRVGGRWRYVVRHGDMEVAFHGDYREIDAPYRLVSTEVFEGAPVPDPEAAGTLNIVTLEESDGVTTLSVLVQAPDQFVRDAIIDSGMEGGLQVSYDRLENLVTQSV